MNIGPAIYSILTSDATIGGYVSTKVYPLAAPQNTAMPYITYQLVSDKPNKNKDRVTSIETLRVQIDVIAKTYENVGQIADAIVNALSFYSGTVAGITIDIITFEDENDLSDVEADVYRKEQDYFLRIKP